MSTLTTFIRHSSGSPKHNNQTTKRNKRHPNWQGRNKNFTICKCHDTIYRKPKRLHQKTARIDNEFSKVAGYKINVRNLLPFYTQIIKQQKKEIKKTIPSTPAPKIIRYPGINLTKDVKDLNSENYKILNK